MSDKSNNSPNPKALANIPEDFLETLKALYKSEIMQQFSLYVKGEMIVLTDLFKHQDLAKSPSQIAKETSISPARVAAILNSLEKKHLIERTIDQDDRRKILVKITSEGIQHAEEARSLAARRIDKIFQTMGEDATRQLILSLQDFHRVASQLYEEELAENENTKVKSQAISTDKK